MMKGGTVIAFLTLLLPLVNSIEYFGDSIALFDIANVQLVGFEEDAASYKRAQGLLLLTDSHNHQAKLCNDGLTSDEARMICYRLGYSHGFETSLGVDSAYKPYANIPTMSKLFCKGTEQALDQCKSKLKMYHCSFSDSKNVELICTNSWYGPGVPCGQDVGVVTAAPNSLLSITEPIVTELSELTGTSARSLEMSRTLKKRMVNQNIIQSAVEFPWTAKLNWWNHLNGEWEHQCGAAIITDRIVITLAQCVGDIGFYSVTIGEFDTKISNRFEETFRVANSVIHPEFEKDPVNNDLAIVILKDKSGLGLQYRPSALPVCLPTANTPLSAGKRKAVVAGWGYQVTETSVTLSRFLTIANVRLYSEQECKGNESPSSGIICAGATDDGRDACAFELGAPLITKINDRSILVGLLRDSACGVKGQPSKYVNIQSHLKWITSTVAEIHRLLKPVEEEPYEDGSDEEIDWSNDDWK